MAEYKVIYREELVGWFYVEADSEEDAIRKFEFQVSEGQIDFGDMALTDSRISAECIEEEGH